MPPEAGGKPSQQHLQAAIRGLSARLRASLGVSSPLGDSLTKGEMREEDVFHAFRPHVPSRYSLSKGVVVNAEGVESDPQDLIISDDLVLPSFLGVGNTKVWPVEAVVGVVQIKSVATATAVKDAVENVTTAKRLLPATERFGVPFGAEQSGFWSTSASFFAGVLFLRLGAQRDTIANAFAEAVTEQEPRERCDALCVVDELTGLWGNPSRGEGLHFAFRGEQAEAPLSLWAGEDSLLFFYLCLVEHLRNWITPPISWLDYVFGADRSSSGLTFSYSYWHDDEPSDP